jgi:hypothetical protein
LEEWEKKTNGNIKKGKGVYIDDYYLSFSENHDQKNHIHLITNKFYYNYSEFIDLFFTEGFEIIPTIMIGYVVKINNKNFIPIKINMQNDAKNICHHMTESFMNKKSFDSM